MRGASRFFLEGIQRHPPSTEEWATQFLMAFSEQVDLVGAVGASIKHHAFQHEAEWRLVMQFFPGDVCSLIFRQKRTLLARHLPINFATDIGADGKHRLSITRAPLLRPRLGDLHRLVRLPVARRAAGRTRHHRRLPGGPGHRRDQGQHHRAPGSYRVFPEQTFRRGSRSPSRSGSSHRSSSGPHRCGLAAGCRRAGCAARFSL